MPFIDANGVSLHYDACRRARALRRAAARAWRHAAIPGTRSRRGLPRDFACCATTSAAPALSEKVRQDFSNDTLVEDFEALAKSVGLDPPYHFVTVAAAATQALRFLEKHPDQVGALVLCNPAPGVDPSRAAALDERAAFAMREGMRASLPTTLALSYPATLGERAAYEAYLGRYLANDPVGVRPRLSLPGAHQYAAHAAADPLPDDGRRRPARYGAAACRHGGACRKRFPARASN